MGSGCPDRVHPIVPCERVAEAGDTRVCHDSPLAKSPLCRADVHAP